ncbi:RHS repeat-associated core domain-containing protein, partial [Candidatus Woesearchaeota archaeon]|nr:RHS repeat-associated core domain-containing protein [Candidatus Woesearchaeota archaeon]
IANSGVDYPFTGKGEDESGLYYFGARYYDDNLGRFVSVDPIASEPAYQYVGNNPMNYVDPTGMLESHLENKFDIGGGKSINLYADTPQRLKQLTSSFAEIFEYDPATIRGLGINSIAFRDVDLGGKLGEVDLKYMTIDLSAGGLKSLPHEVGHFVYDNKVKGYRGLARVTQEYFAEKWAGFYNTKKGFPVRDTQRFAMLKDVQGFFKRYQISPWARGYGETVSVFSKVTKYARETGVSRGMSNLFKAIDGEAFGLAGDVWGSWGAYNDPASFQIRRAEAKKTAESMGALEVPYKIGWTLMNFFEIGAAANSPALTRVDRIGGA